MPRSGQLDTFELIRTILYEPRNIESYFHSKTSTKELDEGSTISMSRWKSRRRRGRKEVEKERERRVIECESEKI